MKVWSDLWDKIPIVVKVYFALFWVLLVATIVIWILDGFIKHEEGHHLYPIFANAFTAAFGTVIGALSQWAHQEFGKGSG